MKGKNLFYLPVPWSDFGSLRSMMFSTWFQLCLDFALYHGFHLSEMRDIIGTADARCLSKRLFLGGCSALKYLSINGLWDFGSTNHFWKIYFSICSCFLPLNLVHNISMSMEDVNWCLVITPK